MSIADVLMRVAGYERRPLAQGKAASEGELPYTWPMWAEGMPDMTPPTLQGFTTAGYSANGIVYACIARKAESAALAPPVAYMGERAAPERVEDDHPLAQLLRRPNPFMSWYEFQELLIVYLELDGNVFVYKARERPGGPVVGLYPLRSDRVRPVPKAGRLLGYVYDGQDMGHFLGLEPFLPEDVIHVKYPNPADPFEGLGRGTSPLAAAARVVDLDNSNTSFLGQFFANAAVPFGLLKTKVKLLDSEVGRIRARIRAQYAGSRNWHEMMILDADAEYQRLGLDMKELEFSSLDARNEARICAVMRVPPIIAGARLGIERSTYANYGEARRSFWEDTLVPMYRRFADGWNASLAEEFGGAWVDYDFGQVPALAEPPSALEQRTVEAWKSSLLRRNEARARIGLPEDEMDGYFNELVSGGLGLLGGGVAANAAPFREELSWERY